MAVVVANDPFPYIRIRMRVRGWETDALALLDTGFTGDLVVPDDLIPEYIGDPDYLRTYRVADDRIHTSRAFYGEIEIPGLPIISDVSIGAFGSRYLIGLGIIERYTVSFVRGEQVVIEM